MSNIWMIVDHGISEGTGYSRRVLFELEVIYNHFGEKPLLIHPETVTIPNEFFSYAIPVSININKPLLFERNKTKKELKKLVNIYGYPRMLYGQNLLASFIATSFTKNYKIPLVFDYHGIVPIEAKEVTKGLKGIIKYIVYKFIESITIRRADQIFVVSNNFSSYIGNEEKTLVLPMLPSIKFIKREDENSRNNRKLLNIKSKTTVYCYLGQAQDWQLANETLKYYSLIEREQRNTFLLILSKDIEKFEKLAKSLNIKNYTILTVPHEEVPSYLAECDYGFVFRGPSMINQVSSPTKVLEYVSQGVTPIMTEYVGDYSELLVKQKLGLVVPFKRLVKNIKENTLDKTIFDSNSTIKQKGQYKDFVLKYRNKYLKDFIDKLRDILNKKHDSGGS